LSLALAAATATVVTADPDSSSLAIGDSAPMRETRMKSVDGRELSIAEAAGKKGTLVVVMCNHCPWVRAWQGRITWIGNDAMKQGIGVIAVNPNDPAAFPEDDLDHMKKQSAQLALKFPYVVDATSDVSRAFGATRTPEAFLFDAQGKLVYHGTVDDNARNEKAVEHRWLRQAVDAVANGRAVPVAETKAFGCGVKFREKRSS
jgi:hypothetical protein